MATIHLKTDCGNSPKRAWLKAFNVAFAEGQVDYLLDCVTDDVVWEIIGDKTLQGKAAYAQTLTDMQDYPIAAYRIDHIITHGKEGAVNGQVTLANGTLVAFCDIYEFANAKGTQLRRIVSYAQELPNA